jgi:hypothetical protein
MFLPLPSMPLVPCTRGKFDITFGEGSKANGTVKRHAWENYDKAINSVQALELRMNVEIRWCPEDKEWEDAVALVLNRRYRHAVDNLEGLVVKRLLELTKVNQSGLGIVDLGYSVNNFLLNNAQHTK